MFFIVGRSLSASSSRRCLSCGVTLVRQVGRLPPTARIPVTRTYARGNPRSSQQKSTNPIVQYLNTLRWVPIPLGVGFAYISYQQYGHVVKREEKKIHETNDPEDLLVTDWVVRLYRCLPLRILSRLWGRINNLELPPSFRPPLLRLYIWAFGCNLDEAVIRDLEHYRNLADFFRRRLRPGVRPVDKNHLITCPSDGVVLHLGRADRGILEQVKGITYSLQDFLGPRSWPCTPDDPLPTRPEQKQAVSKTDDSLAAGNGVRMSGKLSPSAYAESLKSRPENELYHCVIYLAPGDYHGFHSPTEWIVAHRRHFPGELFSVNPGVARLVKGLFNLNERALYMGHYKHGFFCMAAVGATNVGSIRVYHDQYLETNEAVKFPPGAYLDESYHVLDLGGIPMKRGDAFGEFNLGSTIVLVFEAPTGFQFKVEPGQKVKYGQPLGTATDAAAG